MELTQTSYDRLSSRLKQLKEEIKSTGSVRASVRDVLSWYDSQRRSQYIINDINKLLSSLSIQVTPPLDEPHIDSQVEFTASPTRPTPAQTIPIEVDFYVEPTQRISRLKSASNIPVSVKPDDNIARAITLMMQHDYSQLPVYNTPSQLKGMISWHSIAKAFYFGANPKSVKECLESPIKTLKKSDSIFEAIPLIIEHAAVIVTDDHGLVCGIITATDIGVQFKHLGEPFILIGEIENHLRLLLNGHFNIEELTNARHSRDSSRKVENVSSLSFGELIRLIEIDANWTRLKIPLERNEFVKNLIEIKNIRNNVMHFDPDGLTDSDLDLLRVTAKFLRSLSEITKVHSAA